MSKKEIGTVRDLKGRTIAVSQIGDPPYNYTNALLAKFGMGPRDVQWIAAGADANARAAALASGRADATLLTPPAYDKVEDAGFKVLANLADHDDIFAATTYLMRKSTVTANPRLPEQLIKAHAEAIKRFYDDKAFAVKAYQAYDRQQTADVERFYEGYRQANLLERVPYVLTGAVNAVIEQQVNPQLAAVLKAGDYRTLIDNSTVDRLVKEGFFQSSSARRSGPKKSARRSRRSDRHGGRVSRRPRRQLPSATRDSRGAQGSTHHAGRAARD